LDLGQILGLGQKSKILLFL